MPADFEKTDDGLGLGARGLLAAPHEDGPPSDAENIEAAAAPPPPNVEEDWAAFNERMRTSAAKLTTGHVESSFVVLRKTTTPAAALMKENLLLSEYSWCRNVAAEVAKGGELKYRIVETTRLTDLYMTDLRALYDSSHWADFDPSW